VINETKQNNSLERFSQKRKIVLCGDKSFFNLFFYTWRPDPALTFTERDASSPQKVQQINEIIVDFITPC
jgi:hypothetical protein